MNKKYLLGGAILGIMLELGVINYETNKQKAIDYHVGQARTELAKKQDELKNVDAKIGNSQKHIAMKEGGSKEKLAEQDVAQTKAKKQVSKLLKMLYTYDSGDEKLKIPDKVKDTRLVSEKVLKTNSIFKNDRQLELQYSGVDMTGQIDELDLKAGVLENNQVPVYAKVYFEMTKDDRTLGTPTDAYQLMYDTETNQITSIKYFGRYQIDREAD